MTGFVVQGHMCVYRIYKQRWLWKGFIKVCEKGADLVLQKTFLTINVENRFAA